jgi:uncharacterized protein (DUF433 family)
MTRVSVGRRTIEATVPSYTVAQAAVLTGVPVKQINQYLDRELSFLVTIGAGFRAVRKDGLVWLRLNHELSGALTREYRLQVINQVMTDPRKKSVSIPGGAVAVRTDLARTAVAARLAKWRTCKDEIVESDDIMSGEPCLRGTRLSAYVLSDLAKACGRAEALGTYPGVSEHELDAAIMYAEMFPRKGRPRSIGARLDKAKPNRSRTVRVTMPD